MNETNNITRHLGQKSEYIDTYDASLLAREPRQSNRTYLGIQNDQPPFVGTDTWNAYEFSTLNALGMPVVGVLKLVYSCASEYIVESKSLKLYLGSFANQKSYSTQPAEVLSDCAPIIANDLTKFLSAKVKVTIDSNSSILNTWNNNEADAEWLSGPVDLNSYITIEDAYPVNAVEFKHYEEKPELLLVCEAGVDVARYHSSLLRSRCKVTQQPDSGDIFIEIHGKQSIDPISLLEYIVSFRNECHFHEEICEAVYKRIWDACKPEKLAVRCLYARRGGIDINPERLSHPDLAHYCLSDTTEYHVKLPRQ